MAKVKNPRFPHYMRVSRVKTDENGNSMYDDETGEDVVEIVLESECGQRDLVRGVDVDIKVIKSDYKLAFPRSNAIINPLDKVEFIHCYTGEVIYGKVERYFTNNLGSNIWFQSNGNSDGET